MKPVTVPMYVIVITSPALKFVSAAPVRSTVAAASGAVVTLIANALDVSVLNA